MLRPLLQEVSSKCRKEGETRRTCLDGNTLIRCARLPVVRPASCLTSAETQLAVERAVRGLAARLVAALVYCYSPSQSNPVVLHRGLRPENCKHPSFSRSSNCYLTSIVLVVPLTANRIVRLAHFGLGRILVERDTTTRSHVGVRLTQSVLTV